jgi:hypothetical protein
VEEEGHSGGEGGAGSGRLHRIPVSRQGGR